MAGDPDTGSDDVMEGGTAVDDTAASKQRLLCSLTNHQAPITAVRWSPNGDILASASDSGAVLLWKLRVGGVVRALVSGSVWGSLLNTPYAQAAPSFGSTERHVENWSRVVTFHGHSLGMLHAAVIMVAGRDPSHGCRATHGALQMCTMWLGVQEERGWHRPL